MNTVCKFLLACWLAMPAFENHADEIVPGDNLVVEGIPNIPRSLAEEVRRYSEFRWARFLDRHPVRKEMLIATPGQYLSVASREISRRRPDSTHLLRR